MSGTLGFLLDRHAPEITVNFKPQKYAWFAPVGLGAKRLLERVWLHNKSPYYRSQLKRHINHYNKLNYLSKKELYESRIENDQHNPTKLWKAMNNTLHRSEPLSLPSHFDNLQLANEFSHFFNNKIDAVRQAFSLPMEIDETANKLSK